MTGLAPVKSVKDMTLGQTANSADSDDCTGDLQGVIQKGLLHIY